MNLRKILIAVKAVEQSEGMGAKVRRSIGGRELRNFDPFLLLDEFNVKPPAGFPDHPHRGFETVTYMLTGRFQHEDFAGHSGIIGPGDLQWMTAGKGIVHAEMPATTESSTGLQLWVNLAKKDKLCEPAYQELKDTEIPHAKPSPGIDIKVIAGESYNVKSPVYTKTPTMYLDFKMKKGEKYSQKIPAGWNVFLYTLSGSINIQGTTYEAHNTLVTEKLEEESAMEFETEAEECHFVLIGGQPLNEPIVQHGPFVMNTKQEIQQAFMDYSYGENGFERAPTFQSKIANANKRE